MQTSNVLNFLTPVSSDHWPASRVRPNRHLWHLNHFCSPYCSVEHLNTSTVTKIFADKEIIDTSFFVFVLYI